MLRLATLALAFVAVLAASLVSAHGLFSSSTFGQKLLPNRRAGAGAAPTQFLAYNARGSVRSEPTMDPLSPLLFVGSSAGEMLALNSYDLSKNFSFKSGASVYGAAAVAHSSSSVFYGDQVGNFYSLSLRTGALQWTKNFSYAITGRPTLVPNNGNPLVVFGTYDATIYALRQSDGGLVWNITTGSFVSASGVLSTTIWGVDVVIIGSQDGTLYALEAPTGKVMWSWFDGREGKSDPIVDACAVTKFGAAICAARKGRIFAINVSTGFKIFEKADQFSGTTSARPVLSPDQQTVYVPADFNKMFAINANTGETRWSYVHSNAYLNNAAEYVTLRDGTNMVVFGTDDAATTLVALDPQSGNKLWETTTAGTAAANAGPVTTRCVFTTDQRSIVCGTAGGFVIAAGLQ
jgi:outer membrane protein assembly factor BamB